MSIRKLEIFWVYYPFNNTVLDCSMCCLSLNMEKKILKSVLENYFKVFA